MGLVDVIINATLYILLFLFVLKRNKTIGPIEILLALYVVVALCGVNLYLIDSNRWNLSLIRYLYLFAAVVVFMLGIIKDKQIVLHSNPISNYGFYKGVSVVYVLLSLFSCAYYIPIVYLVLQNPEWAELYSESHEMVESNLIIKIANAFFHLRYLGVILFFSMLTHKNCSGFLKILLGIGAFLPVFLVTILNASRGGLIILVGSLIIAYFIFKPLISKKIKKKIRRLALLCIPIFVAYFVAVSLSRFENAAATGYQSSGEAFWDYLGHSMMYFNNGVMDSIREYGYGSYMFNLQDNSIKGTNFGTNFITFIGCMYLDFGALGTILIGLALSVTFGSICKRKLGVPELFLLLNYIMYLFYGAFVTAAGYGYQWIEIIIIYLGLKLFQRL